MNLGWHQMMSPVPFDTRSLLSGTHGYQLSFPFHTWRLHHVGRQCILVNPSGNDLRSKCFFQLLLGNCYRLKVSTCLSYKRATIREGVLNFLTCFQCTIISDYRSIVPYFDMLTCSLDPFMLRCLIWTFDPLTPFVLVLSLYFFPSLFDPLFLR